MANKLKKKKEIYTGFKHNNKSYKLSLRIDETIVTPTRGVSEQK